MKECTFIWFYDSPEDWSEAAEDTFQPSTGSDRINARCSSSSDDSQMLARSLTRWSSGRWTDLSLDWRWRRRNDGIHSTVSSIIGKGNHVNDKSIPTVSEFAYSNTCSARHFKREDSSMTLRPNHFLNDLVPQSRNWQPYKIMMGKTLVI